MSCLLSHSRILGFLSVCLFAVAMAAPARAQQQAGGVAADDISVRPIYVTARIFQVKAKRESVEYPAEEPCGLDFPRVDSNAYA